MSLKENYWGHTPVFWKKIGESVRALGMGITAMTIYADNHNAAFVCLIATWAGNTIINFASE